MTYATGCYTKLKIWGQDLPYYQSIGVLGQNDEMDKAWSILGPHNYLLARMGWNMKFDWKQLLSEYCTKAFGKGGPAMEKYYHSLIAAQEAHSYETGAYGSTHLIFSRKFVVDSKALFKEATASADTDHHKKMIDYFGQSVDALSIYLDYHDAVIVYDFPKAQAAFDAMVAHWDKYLALNSNLVSRYGRRYINWLFKGYVTKALAYSTGENSILFKFPDEVTTMLDPHGKGQLMGFQRPELTDEGKIKTKTFTSTWDAQGLGAYRPGSVWYRQWFEAPKSLDGKSVGFFLGGVEDEANVYVNGEYVGTGRGFLSAFTFDITPQLKLGAKNLIAIQIQRRNLINEMGYGGIIYPSFVFLGPKLEKAAPSVVPSERILPGGARAPIEK